MDLLRLVGCPDGLGRLLWPRAHTKGQWSTSWGGEEPAARVARGRGGAAAALSDHGERGSDPAPIPVFQPWKSAAPAQRDCLGNS